MAEQFKFDARQFYDFSRNGNEDEEENVLETYFDNEHEDHEIGNNIATRLIGSESEGEVEFFSPSVESAADSNTQMFLRSKIRRSISVGNILPIRPADNNNFNYLCQNFNSLNISEVKKESSKNMSSSSLKSKSSVRSYSRENLNRLAQPKRKYCSEEQLNQKYVSMAEQINKFSQSTPTRFRSKPAPKIINKISSNPTIPHSPKLSSKDRRRRLNILSKEQQEEKELDEAKKYKIKAHPVNKKVLYGPIKLPTNIETKQPTVVQPFNLTNVPKKVCPSPKQELFKFESQPIPKSTYEPNKPTIVKKSNTVAQTPNFSKRFAKTSVKNDKPEYNKEAVKIQKLVATQVMPFSFDHRSDLIRQKREEFVNKVIEEEKKAREFHARPIPKGLLKSRNISSESIGNSTITSPPHKSNNSSLGNTTIFKAKPATVLNMKPFEPKKYDHHLTEIVEFTLNTDRRAKEREEFEQKLKIKEEMSLELKQKHEELKLLQEEQEIARLRREAEHKAQPIKKYKELKIVHSNKITIPITPKFSRKTINKENFDNNS